jgi:hypothetical protein
MTTANTLKTALTELAQIRAASVALNVRMHAAKEAFNLQHADLIHSINDHAARLAEAEALVRALTLAVYEQTGEKKAVVGAEVAIRTTYSYSDADAMAWAETALPNAITRKLDTKAIDKIASTGALPFATKVETPTVRIASDLTAYEMIPEPSNV